MKPTVAKYLCSRIDNMVGVKIKELLEEFRIPDKYLSKQERFDLLVSGKVELRKDFLAARVLYDHTNIERVYDFSPYENHNEYRDGLKKALSKVKAEAQRIKDEVWLGDEANAMELLRAFEDY